MLIEDSEQEYSKNDLSSTLNEEMIIFEYCMTREIVSVAIC